ncbi:MAG TPA: Asp-tRNA(Asn)/Glu-tRNA(Gln) amidotransferase subunit GatB [Gemmatimonadaceae bacterium]
MTSALEKWKETYEMVVGLEVHVHLKTATKIFCRCSTDFGAPPNANTCPVCLALPGALPVINDRAVELAIRASLALGCTVHETSIFARKNYFYPDSPKGYQISQFDRPLATEGCVRIGTRPDGSPINVRVHRVHMEEDAGKSVHDRFPGVTAIDLNRSGVPLVEIVSEPDMRNPDEVNAYLTSLKQILEYADVSNVSMEEGSLRVDANISTRRVGETKLGTKTEVKNMNSFSGVMRALEVEFDRQCTVLESGGRIEQQTMLWDANTNQVRPARSKEGSHDYRYFPDPDLPPLVIPTDRIDDIKSRLPELPDARRDRYARDFAGLTAYDIEVLTSSPAMGDYFEHVARRSGEPKAAANWMMGEVLASLKETKQEIAHFTIRPADLGDLLKLVRDGTISNSAAKQVFSTMLKSGDPPAAIAEREGLRKVSDDGALTSWIDEVLAEHPEEAQRFLGGEKRLQGVLVGYVMKKSKGSADPKRVNQLLVARAGT